MLHVAITVLAAVSCAAVSIVIKRVGVRRGLPVPTARFCALIAATGCGFIWMAALGMAFGQ